MKNNKKMRRSVKLFLLAILAVGLSFGAFYITKTYIFKDSVDNKQKKEKNTNDNTKEKEEVKEIYPKTYELSMIMTGDALIHTTVYGDAHLGNNNYDFTKQMEYIAPIIKDYDLAYYNQETIIGGKDLGMSSFPLFNSPDEIGDCMVGMGFNMVSLANNHTLDKGEKGVLYSVNYWKQHKDVLAVGQYDSWEARNEKVIKEKNNIKYTMFSYTTQTNGLLPQQGKEYLTNIYSDAKAKEDIEKVKDEVDIIFVAMHWGNEYSHTASPEQKRIATYLSELGVHVIIGSHPHVLQPIEYINDTLVIYSLGNYISAQIGIERLTGVLVNLNITKTVNKDQSSKITLSNLNTELIYTHYRNWSNYKVIPYRQLTNDLLPSYETHYKKYSDILKSLDNTIPVTSLE